MTQRLYWLRPWSDEVVPCDSSLVGWATWLSTPDPEWTGREDAAFDGEEFVADVVDLLADVHCTASAEGWRVGATPPDATYFYVRFGPGLGWDAEISGETPAEALSKVGGGDASVILAAMGRPWVERLRYEAAGPRLVVLGREQ